MSKILNDSLIYEILSVVEEIPEGCVASYGQIASLIGREKNARQRFLLEQEGVGFKENGHVDMKKYQWK